MTDRYHSLTVVLADNTRDDDAQAIIEAISMIKGIMGVKGNMADSALLVAEMREKNNLRKKLWEILK